MNAAGVRGVCIRSPGQGRTTAAPFVRLPGQKRRVDEFTEDRDIRENSLPLQELASAATTLGFLGDTPTEVFASAGLLLTAAAILVAEALQSSSDARANKETGAVNQTFSGYANLLGVAVVRSQAGIRSRKRSVTVSGRPPAAAAVRQLVKYCWNDCNGNIVHAAPTSDPPPARAVAKSQAPSSASSTLTKPDNVSQARDWILAWRARQAAFLQPVVESVALSDSAISESLQESASKQETDAEARRQDVKAWISEFRVRTEANASAPSPAPAVPVASQAVEAQSASTSDEVKAPNPFVAFFSWLRSLWTAIINLFKQDSGSKPQTA